MGRVINLDSTGKHRNQHMRTIAELLRRLSQKSAPDDETKDMVARIAICLREINDGIEASAGVWDDRNYYKKADELRMRWDWTAAMADRLRTLVYDEKWDDLPTVMIKLLPHVSDITITKMTRTEDDWVGSYRTLLDERPAT